MTKQELEALAKELCPHCDNGRPAIYRRVTDEWVHDLASGSHRGQTYCLATKVRNEHPEAT